MNEWKQAIDKMTSEIILLQSHGKYNNILISGDINFPKANWALINAGIPPESQSVDGIQIRMLTDFMSQFFMTQSVEEATRNNNILDVIISNNSDMISNHKFVKNNKFSDHDTIISELNIMSNDIQVKTKKIITDTNIPKYDMNNASKKEWDTFSEHINANTWDKVSESITDIDEKVKLLNEHIENAADKSFQSKI